MWYFIILALTLALFFLSPYEPLLQASNRERVLYRDISDKFPLFSKFRIIIAALSCMTTYVVLYIIDGPLFLLPFFLLAAVLYTSDFITAGRIAKASAESNNADPKT
jgi:hypothetical protein